MKKKSLFLIVLFTISSTVYSADKQLQLPTPPHAKAAKTLAHIAAAKTLAHIADSQQPPKVTYPNLSELEPSAELAKDLPQYTTQNGTPFSLESATSQVATEHAIPNYEVYIPRIPEAMFEPTNFSNASSLPPVQQQVMPFVIPQGCNIVWMNIPWNGMLIPFPLFIPTPQVQVTSNSTKQQQQQPNGMTYHRAQSLKQTPMLPCEQCEQCDKKFPSKSKLTRHMTVHTGEKRYGCPLCPKRYTQNASLNVHLRTVHQETTT